MGERSPVTVAGPRRILTGFLSCRRLAPEVHHGPRMAVNSRMPHPARVCRGAHATAAGRSALVGAFRPRRPWVVERGQATIRLMPYTTAAAHSAKQAYAPARAGLKAAPAGAEV